MAFVDTFTCSECNSERTEVVDNNGGVCCSCRLKKSSKAKRLHLSGLKGLTVEERLSRLEELEYDVDAGKRLSSLEGYHARY